MSSDSQSGVREPATPSRPATTRCVGDAFVARSIEVRARSFWSGWPGLVATGVMAAVIVALLVGWVLLWVLRPEGPSVTLLTLGTVSFAALLAALVTLIAVLRRTVRLHHAEATFLTAVSHHLRTPIAGIRAAAQMLDHPGVTPEQHARLVTAIVGETDRLVRLVENVMETGRLETGRPDLAAEEMDLGALLQQAVRERRAGTFVTLTVTVDAPLPIIGERHSLRLLLDNLLDNAIKYGPPEGEVQLDGRVVEGRVRLTIRDAGCGFDAETSRRLFTRFQRGDTGGAHGWGLGLALSRAIAHAHGGEVGLTSPGRGLGATATLDLPLAPCRRGAP